MSGIHIWILVLVGCTILGHVKGHARLVKPPGRSSMWRYGFPVPKNSDDNELYCGGLKVQWERNGGKCGLCGDPYDMPHPRDNEAGGKYGTGIIGATYTSGQVIDVVVYMSANHFGSYEFKLCPNNDIKKEATQECLDQYVLKQPNGESKIDISKAGWGNVTAQLQLPEGLTCSQCVFQWNYVAANNHGDCGNGTSKLGCGPQELFRTCADIEIKDASGNSDSNKDSSATNGQVYTEHTMMDSHKHGMVDPHIPPYFDRNNYNFEYLPISDLKDFDFKSGYYIIPNINFVDGKLGSKKNVTYFYFPNGSYTDLVLIGLLTDKN